VEQLEAVPGLAESVVLIEGVGFLNDVLFSGILFALLPTLYLVPLLYGKIEPLLGIKPRNPGMKYEGIGFFRPKLILIGVLLLALAFGAESLSEMDINFAVWETDYADQYGSASIWISIGAAALIAVVTLLIMRAKRSKNKTVPGTENRPYA